MILVSQHRIRWDTNILIPPPLRERITVDRLPGADIKEADKSSNLRVDLDTRSYSVCLTLAVGVKATADEVAKCVLAHKFGAGRNGKK